MESEKEFGPFARNCIKSIKFLKNLNGKDISDINPIEIKKDPLSLLKDQMENAQVVESKATLKIKKTAVTKATISNLSERILKSHSEGNRYITNDDL
jgi:hypothetical protein